MMSDQPILKLFRKLNSDEIQFLYKCGTQVSFIADKTTLSSPQTKITHQLPSTRIQVRGHYILQCETNTAVIVSGLKLDFTTKFRKLTIAKEQNQTEKINGIVLSFLQHPYAWNHSEEVEMPFSEKQVELQILSSQAPLLNFIKALTKKSITQVLAEFKLRYDPIKKISSSSNQTLFKIRDPIKKIALNGLCYLGIAQSPKETYELLSCLNKVAQLNPNGIIRPAQVLFSQNSILCVFKSLSLCSFATFLMAQKMSMEKVQRVTELLLRNSQNILKAGISVNEMRPENLLIQLNEQHIQNLYFCSYRQALFDPNPEFLQEMHLSQEKQLKLWTQKIELHKKIGLLLYFMLTRQEQIFEYSSSINPDNIIGHMVELENPEFPQSAQRLIKALIHDNDTILSLEQLLETQFFTEEQQSLLNL